MISKLYQGLRGPSIILKSSGIISIINGLISIIIIGYNQCILERCTEAPIKNLFSKNFNICLFFIRSSRHNIWFIVIRSNFSSEIQFKSKYFKIGCSCLYYLEAGMERIKRGKILFPLVRIMTVMDMHLCDCAFCQTINSSFTVYGGKP